MNSRLNDLVIYENCSIIKAKEVEGRYIIHAVAKQNVLGEILFTPIYIKIDKCNLNSLPQVKEKFNVAGPFHNNPDMGVFFDNPSMSLSNDTNDLSTGFCIVLSKGRYFYSDLPGHNNVGVFVFHRNLVLLTSEANFSGLTLESIKKGLRGKSPNKSQQNKVPNNMSQAKVGSEPIVNGGNDSQENVGVVGQGYNQAKRVDEKDLKNNVQENNVMKEAINPTTGAKEPVNTSNTLGITETGEQLPYDKIVLDEATVRNLINIV